MSTCCLNKIDCARLLGCLGMDLCLEDDRELGIKGEGRKGISAPPVNLKASRLCPNQRHSGGLLALLLWCGLRWGRQEQPRGLPSAAWVDARCQGVAGPSPRAGGLVGWVLRAGCRRVGSQGQPWERGTRGWPGFPSLCISCVRPICGSLSPVDRSYRHRLRGHV